MKKRTRDDEAVAEHDTNQAAAGAGAAGGGAAGGRGRSLPEEAEKQQHGEHEERQGAKRGRRTVVDYGAFGRKGGVQHLQGVWAQTVGGAGPKGNSTSVRVEVAKGLEAFFRKLHQQLQLAPKGLDPSEEECEARANRDKQLEVEEERLSAEAKRLEEELRELVAGNLQNRSELRLIAAHGVELVDVERLLASVPRRTHADVVHANKEGDEDEEALELRKEASAAFAQFVGDAAALGDETANAQREGRVGRLLTVWNQRAENQTKDTAAVRVADKGPVAVRSKLVAAFKN